MRQHEKPRQQNHKLNSYPDAFKRCSNLCIILNLAIVKKKSKNNQRLLFPVHLLTLTVPREHASLTVAPACDRLVSYSKSIHYSARGISFNDLAGPGPIPDFVRVCIHTAPPALVVIKQMKYYPKQKLSCLDRSCSLYQFCPNRSSKINIGNLGKETWSTDIDYPVTLDIDRQVGSDDKKTHTSVYVRTNLYINQYKLQKPFHMINVWTRKMLN